MQMYPELTKQQYDGINSLVEAIAKYLAQGVNSNCIDENGKIPEQNVQQLKELGLFGQRIPQEYVGLELNATKYARIAEGTVSDGSASVTLAGHQAIGFKGLLNGGCLPEPNVIEMARFAF